MNNQQKSLKKEEFSWKENRLGGHIRGGEAGSRRRVGSGQWPDPHRGVTEHEHPASRVLGTPHHPFF